MKHRFIKYRLVPVVLSILFLFSMAVCTSSTQVLNIHVVHVSSYQDIPFDAMPVNTVFIYPLDTCPDTYSIAPRSNTNTVIDTMPSTNNTFNANAEVYSFSGECDSGETLYSKHYLTGNTKYDFHVQNYKKFSSQVVECYNYNNHCIFSITVDANSGMTGLVEPSFQRWYFKIPGACNVEGWAKGA